jgi:hypothetical protein
MKTVSQKTLVELKKVFEAPKNRGLNYGDLLYENDFPDWFVVQASQTNVWDWMVILLSLRRGTFFFARDRTGFGPGYPRCIVIDYPSLDDKQAIILGERYIQRLAALACGLSGSESLQRSLQLDGFDVNKDRLALVPLEGPISARDGEDRLTTLVKKSGLPNGATVVKHITDAQSLYTDGKNHSSLNESRSLIQGLIDGISKETSVHGKHSTKLPGGTSNRIEFLTNVGFLTADEHAAFNSVWGSLSAGSHPGVPEREQARIGLVLALEFGQLLLLKFTDWKDNGCAAFT